MDDFPNLEALGQGCVSGRISEWPLLKVEARKAIDYIARLEAVVRAMDAARAWDMTKQTDSELVWLTREYHAARSRVNLPPVTSQSQPEGVDDGHESADKCGPDCTLHVVRPGKFQCNGDGAKCPNKEASDGKEA